MEQAFDELAEETIKVFSKSGKVYYISTDFSDIARYGNQKWLEETSGITITVEPVSLVEDCKDPSQKLHLIIKESEVSGTVEP